MDNDKLKKQSQILKNKRNRTNSVPPRVENKVLKAESFSVNQNSSTPQQPLNTPMALNERRQKIWKAQRAASLLSKEQKQANQNKPGCGGCRRKSGG